MKTHITKLVAVLMAVLMMVSLVPAAALSDFNLPALFSVFGGTNAVENGATVDGENAETAIPTEDGTPVTPAGGGDGLYMAADGTLYMDTDGDGVAEDISGDTIADEDFGMVVTQGKVTDDETYYALGTGEGVPEQISPYEPSSNSGNENDPFLPGGDAWINLSKIFYGAPAMPTYPITKWSANTSVFNVTAIRDANGDVTGYALPDMDLIDKSMWEGGVNVPKYSVDGQSNLTIKYATEADASKNSNTAYAYNRYDAMQGKWGVTLDKNVKTMTWTATGTRKVGNKNVNNTVLYLTDTPYLYYSTEALDGTKLAISLLIGTPVQTEVGTDPARNGITNNPDLKGQTSVYDTPKYEYRWYTITDNAERPGISSDTLDRSMTPNVTISDVVATVTGMNNDVTAAAQQVNDVMAALEKNNATDPIALVGDKADSLYVDGAITGCIDFSNLLPLVMGSLVEGSAHDNGREDVQYKVAKVRVDTKTVAGTTDSAARINYLYFGPGQSMVYTPQTTNGADVNAYAWMYKQDANKPNTEANDSTFLPYIDYVVNTSPSVYDKVAERAYTSGWENGEAVSIVNTPNDPQKIIIDTYGKYGGELIGGQSDTYHEAFLDQKSKIWQFIDNDGNIQRLEAEYNENDDSYYVMVTIPIRKWVNVLGNSRRLSTVVTLEQPGDATHGGSYKPGFVFWGNESGAHGAGHAENAYAGRFRNEDLLAMFGEDHAYYHVDYRQNFFMMEIDSTLGHSTIYNEQKVEDGYAVYEADNGTQYFLKDGVTYSRKQQTDASGRLVYESVDGNRYYYDATAKKLYDANGVVADIDPIDLNTVYVYTAADLATVFSLTAGASVDGYTAYTDENGNTYYKDSKGTYYTREHKRNSWGSALYQNANDTKYSQNADGTWNDADGNAISAPSDVTPIYIYELAFLEKVYDNTESWYDILRSPYMYDQTVTKADATCNITDDMIGYVYISSLRFAMPVGSKMMIQNMKGDGNSAGLNMYSTSGSIVSAYDGGSGSQPVTDVAATLPEQAATLKTNASLDPSVETHNYATSGDGIIKGTQEDRPAAYGPYLEDSYYTIYDLLDVEQVNGHGKHFDNTLGAKNPIYGTNVVSDRVLTIYSGPRAGSTEYGTIKSGAYIPLYASIFTGTQRWGLTGVKTKEGTAEMGWFAMTSEDGKTPYTWHGGDDTDANDINKGQNKQNKFLTLGNYSDYGDGTQNGTNDDKIKWTALGMISSNWHLSSFNTGSDMNFQNGGTNDYSATNYVMTANDLYSAAYTRTMLAYANYSRDKSGYSSASAMDQNVLVTNNSTELEIRQIDTNDTGRGFAISRTLSAPVRLHQGGTQSGYPVLYYDIGADSAEATFCITLSVVKKQAYYLKNANGTISETDAVAVDNQLFFLDGKNGLLSDTKAFAPGTGYISLKNLMTQSDQAYWNWTDPSSGKNYYDQPNNNKAPKYVYEITGIHVYVHRNHDNGAGTIKLDRLEVLQEDTPWLDKINVTSAGSSNAFSERVQLKDSMNIINDAFYHVHNEDADGTYTVTQNGTSVTIDDQTFAAKTDFLGSDIKDNSNSGWMGQVAVDLDHDGQWWSDRATELFNGWDGESQDGVYEYRTALGHVRIWVPSGTNANFILTADRSFNTKNYKYLYYSYSVRDVQQGISAEDLHTSGDRTKDGKGVTGVEVAIKSEQADSQNAYLEQNGTWVYYDRNNDFLGTNRPDDRSYDTTMNAAIDLSSLDNIDSINQIVFYLNNAESRTAEFYINYVTLSNVAPTELIADSLAKPQVQYYYLMDNTGDRYSARFPTIDNPTGAVSGTNSDNDRNNPVIVERGMRLSEGTYFNGDPLYGYGYGTDSTVREFNQNTASVGYYEKLYDGVTEANANQDGNGSFKNIWFYAGVTKDANGNEIKNNYEDITDFYTYKERNNDGSEDIYDMLWSYGRWYTGAGESGLNNMYIGNPDDMNEGDTANSVSGNLVRRYATEDYVLLRSGIQPKRFTTYYSASGGQFRYENSNEQIKENIQLDVNSYYITSTVLFSNFTYPTSGANIIKPFKYGYVFKGWKTTDDLFDKNDTNEKDLYNYYRKEVPGINYFYAMWERDPAFASGKQNVAQFYINDGTEKVWFTRVAKYETNENESFKIILPDITQYEDAKGVTQYIRGWREKGNADGTVYTPGQKIVLKQNVNFEPVLATNSVADMSMTVTLHGAKLYLVTEMDANGKYTKLVDLSAAGANGYHGIQCTSNNNVYTYTNLPRDIIVVAKPITTKTYGVWMLTQSTDSSDYAAAEHTVHYLNNTVGTVMSTVNTEYQFSVCSDMELTYTALNTSTEQTKYQDANGAVSTMVSSTTEASDEGREMIFVSSFDLSKVAGAKALAWGTLYTKNNLYQSIDLYSQMTLKESSINAESIDKGSFETTHDNVRQVKASEKSLTNQYYLRITENKGLRVQYFCRSYLIYELNGQVYVTYSNVVLKEYLPAA